MLYARDFTSLQEAVNAAANETVVVSAGDWEITGSLQLKSNMTLHLERGARLLAPKSIEEYSKRPRGGEWGLTHYFIGGYGLENVTIEGDGEIICNGSFFWKDYDGSPMPWENACGMRHFLSHKQRPVAVMLFNCSNVNLRGITLRDAAAYTVWALGCDRLKIENITIANNRRGPNTDGLDIDCCSDVFITGCHINVGDDCIAIKCDAAQLGRNKPCERIHVCGNTLSTTCCAVRIGYEGDSVIRDMVFSDNIIHDCSKGYDIVSVAPPNCYLGVVHGCRVENILFSDTVMRNVEQPMKIWSGSDLPEDRQRYTGHVRNIRYRNIEVENGGPSFFGGLDVNGVSLDGINVRIRRRPSMCIGRTPVEMPNVWGSGYLAEALNYHNVNGLHLTNVEADQEMMETLVDPDFTRIDYCSKYDGYRDWALYSHAGKGRPCVVVLHGHGSHGDQLLHGEKVVEWRRHLLEADVSVLSPNLRDNAWMGGGAVEDLAELIENGRRNFDWSHVFIIAGSMGASGALAFAVRHPELVDGVGALGAATDMRRYADWCSTSEPEVTHDIGAAIRASYKDAAEYDKNSACLNAAALDMPIYLYHGEADAVIPVSEARALNKIMENRENFHYMEIAGGNHDSPLPYFDSILAELLAAVR